MTSLLDHCISITKKNLKLSKCSTRGFSDVTTTKLCEIIEHVPVLNQPLHTFLL